MKNYLDLIKELKKLIRENYGNRLMYNENLLILIDFLSCHKTEINEFIRNNYSTKGD